MTKVPPACPCTTCHRSYAAAAYLQSIGFSKRVFLIGNEGVAEELEAAGIDYVTLEQLCAEAASGSNGSSSSSGGMASSAAALQQQWTAEALANLQVRSWAGALLACLAASMLDQYVWFCSMASITASPSDSEPDMASPGLLAVPIHSSIPASAPWWSAGTPAFPTPRSASPPPACGSCRAATLWPPTLTLPTRWVGVPAAGWDLGISLFAA